MKIFVRAAQMNEKNPQVVGVYPRETEIEPDAHGEDTIMLEVPDRVLIPAKVPIVDPSTAQMKEMPEYDPLPRLPDGWRTDFATPILEGEAARRIGAVMSPSDQMFTIYELLDLLLQHGVNVSKWPASAQTRKAEITDAWNYAREIKSRAASLKMLPANPASDKNWPTKITKTKKKS